MMAALRIDTTIALRNEVDVSCFEVFADMDRLMSLRPDPRYTVTFYHRDLKVRDER